MKKLLLFGAMLLFGVGQLTAQCITTAQFGASTAPSTVGVTVTNSTCNYYGEFSSISGFDTQYIYDLAIAPSGYVTVVPAAGGAAVAFGPSPLSFTPPSNGTYNVHWHQNAACGTDFSCHTTTVTNTGFSAPCTNPAVGGAALASVAMACPGQGINLTLSGATGGSGVTYQWQSSSDNVTFADISGATTGTYSATQTAATYYQCIVTCSAGTPATSSSVMVGQNSFMDCYCSSQPFSTGDEEIYDVTVNGSSTDPLYANANGCSTPAPGPGSLLSQYSNFMSLGPLTQLAPGQSSTFSVFQDECDGPFYYSNGIAIWIDYNQNGLFTDPGEQLYVDAFTAAGPRTVSGTFTVPATAATGNTVMRVICAEGWSGPSLTPCLTYGYGETEDYLISIQCPDLTGLDVSEVGVCSGQTVTMSGSLSFPVATVSWWDSPVGGTQIGSGTSFTSGVLTADTNFYVQEDFPGCPSSLRDTIEVIVTSVSVGLLPIAVTCNNGNDGTFAVAAINCGTPPFSYSVDGGAFGPIPTNLTVGVHNVIVQDATLNQSVTYPVNVGDALAPSALVINTFNNDIADISWTVNGSETSWNVEWGVPGFIPGTGAEEGSGTATSSNYVVSGLVGNTEYDIYVSANCGAGTTAGDWVMTNLTTLCDPLAAQGFCESFDSDSPTQACWSVVNANADFIEWTMDGWNGFGGVGESALINTDFNFGANDDYLITPGLLLTGNEIMTFKYAVLSNFEPNDFEVLLSTTGTAPGDFTNTLMALDSYNNTIYMDTAVDLSAYSGTCYIAFRVPPGGLDGWFLFIDEFCVDICTPAPGIDGTVDVCRLDGTLDLNSVITQGENNGVWSFDPNPFAISNDSIISVVAIPDGTFEAHYLVTTACVIDTTVATFTVFPASSAGIDGILTVCQNQPINLLSGLTGLVDLGGTWFSPTGAQLPSGHIITGTLPGQYNYEYTVSNGVCPNDTANIVMNILPGCDYLGLDETVFEAMTIYPNPTTGIINISNVASGLNFSYEVTDLNGRIVAEKANLNGKQIQEVDLSKVENGIYMVRVFNEQGKITTRIVKQ